MKTVSPEKKSTARILSVLVILGLFVFAQKSFAELQFHDSGFVCTNESLASQQAQYDAVASTLSGLSAQQSTLEANRASWSYAVSVNTSLLASLESQKATTQNRINNLQTYIRANCSAADLRTASATRKQTCNQKQRELENAQQDLRRIQTQITQVRSTLASLNLSIINAQSTLASIQNEIQTTQNFKEDYETCKQFLLTGGVVNIPDFGVVAPTQIFVNEGFDITVTALNFFGVKFDTYRGKVFFDTTTYPVGDIIFPLENGKYQFTAADLGSHTFSGFVITKAGTYQLVVSVPNGPNGEIEKVVQIVATDRV
jgi:predicted  nucleic acid-binding Zn-ribbon protein